MSTFWVKKFCIFIIYIKFQIFNNTIICRLFCKKVGDFIMNILCLSSRHRVKLRCKLDTICAIYGFYLCCTIVICLISIWDITTCCRIFYWCKWQRVIRNYSSSWVFTGYDTRIPMSIISIRTLTSTES